MGANMPPKVSLPKLHILKASIRPHREVTSLNKDHIRLRLAHHSTKALYTCGSP